MTVSLDPWPIVALADVLTDIQPGFASGKHNSEGTGVPHLRPMNVSSDGQIDRSVVKSVDPVLADRPARRLRKGDVVFNNTNSPELVGKTALFTDDDEPAFSNHMTRLRADPARIDPGFLALRLHQAWREGWFAAHCNNHVSQASIGRDVLRSFEIALPPIEAQRAIAELGRDAAQRRRSCTRHLSAATDAIRLFRQTVLAAACSGRLTADWREQNLRSAVAAAPPLSAQANANSSGSPNTDTLIEIPDTWAWWPVESIAERVIDYRGRTPPTDPSGVIPHVRTSQIRDGRIDWKTDRFVTPVIYDSYMTRGIPRRDDVLFTMEAPMGQVGVVDRDDPFSIAQRILLLRPREDLLGEFLAIALRSQPVRRATEYRATGSGVRGVAYKRLRSLLLPKPPLDEQAEIVRRASELLAAANRIEVRIDSAVRLIERTSQAVLAKAFRGDLVPNGKGSEL